MLINVSNYSNCMLLDIILRILTCTCVSSHAVMMPHVFLPEFENFS